MNLDRARELAAQAWCGEKTGAKVMDVELAEEFANILHQHCGDSELVSAMAVLERTTETLASLVPQMPAEGKGLVGDLLNRTVKTSIEIAKLIVARNDVALETGSAPVTIPDPDPAPAEPTDTKPRRDTSGRSHK